MVEKFELETTLKLFSVRMDLKNLWNKITCFWGAREEIVKVEAVGGNLHYEQIILCVPGEILFLFRIVSCSALCCGVH